MKKILLILFLLKCTGAYSSEHFATKLVDFSSSLGGKQFNPSQVLGRPNAMPQGIKSPCAWLSKVANSPSEFITVSFDTIMPIRQVAVFENFNPGGVKSIDLITPEGKSFTVYKGSAQAVVDKQRVFTVIFSLTAYSVKSVRVNFDFSKYAGQKQIDAIGISDSDLKMEAKINIVPFIAWASSPENLGLNVNSEYTEVGPIISPDGKTLFFSRKDHPENIGAEYKVNDDIWYSTLSGGNQWSAAENFGTPLNNTRHNFVESVTPDGNELLLGNHYFKTKTAAEQGTYDGVSVSFRKTNGWTYPKNIEIRNFKNYDQYVNYYLTNDGKAMLMGIEMDDTYGVADIYVSFYENDSTWSAPKNLGPVINSAGSEGTPFLAADGVTLYFCSDGFAGYGSSDIYMSKRLDDTWQHWTEPLNIGVPINTSDWDAYYTLPASGDYAYYVSEKNSLGKEDIFRIQLPKVFKPDPVVLVSGRVINANTNLPLEAKINYQFLPDGISAGTARSEPDSGRYKIVLPAGKVYGWNAAAEGFYSISENFSTDSLQDYTEIIKDIRMLPVEKGQVIRLNNIFFVFAKADLQSSSFPELDRLVTFLKEQLTVNISIDGHTDDIGSDAENQLLSTSRAVSVRSYLLSKGISELRIESHGYGESKPVALNDNEEHRKLNRRVEFQILSR